jgi:hypothetical protein
MSLFGFGGSSQRSSSYGQSSSFDRSDAANVSAGISESGSQQSSQDIVAFEDIFARMFGGAEGAAAGLDPSMLTEAANQLFSGGTGFLERLGGGAGAGYLEDRLSADNPVLQEQIDALGADLGRFFDEELLPGIASDAISGGALGGGRQGVAQGIAAGRVASEFQRGATELRAGDIAARDAAAVNLEGLGIQGAGVGLQNLPALQGIAESGFSADMLPYLLLSQVTGGPTVLGSSQGTSYASAADFAAGYSQSYGRSQSTSRSESSGKSFNMGWG